MREQAQGAVGRGRRPKGQGTRWEPEPLDADEIAEALGTRQSGAEQGQDLEQEVRAAVGVAKSAKILRRLREASDAFKRGRYEEARIILRPIADRAPKASTIRELYGLTLYRVGRWRPAAKELEAFRDLTGSVEQHPVLADCYRALGRHTDVGELWDELRAASPGQELVAEGRIVAAGSLADQGRVTDAIALLEPGIRPARKAKPHHLRVAYALADLYERAGELPQARELFQRVAAAQPDFVDVRARLRALD